MNICRRRNLLTAFYLVLIGLGSSIAWAVEGGEPTSSLDWWLRALKDVGFPVAVAGFLLFRTDRTITEVPNALKDLTAAMKGLREDLRQALHAMERALERRDREL